MYVYVYVYSYMYMCMCICICIYVCASVYICVYVHSKLLTYIVLNIFIYFVLMFLSFKCWLSPIYFLYIIF